MRSKSFLPLSWRYRLECRLLPPRRPGGKNDPAVEKALMDQERKLNDEVARMQLDADAAVVTYKWTGSGPWMGQPIPSPSLASTVWVTRGNNWVAVFHQETTMMTPPAQK